VDAVALLEEAVPVDTEVKRLAGRIVWLREADHEWVGPAEEALALLSAAQPYEPFWAAFL
jgi:endonuclease III